MENHHYVTIEKAIIFIRENFRRQPSLEEIAQHVHLSPFHFQRLFQEWAGISPKKFLQNISLNYAKYLLKEKQLSLFDTSLSTGLSGTGRLHDLFIKIEGMTPAEYKNGGENITISYDFYTTLFGNIILASTGTGICFLHFSESEEVGLKHLQKEFPRADCIQAKSPLHQDAIDFMSGLDVRGTIKLHVKGSPFQLKVWQALLSIPESQLTTYQHIADKVTSQKAARTVGSAIGHNPVAFIIPCHRVIRSDGELGGYMWGLTRKTALIGWEQVRNTKKLKI